MSSQISAGRVRSLYEFIKEHRCQYRVRMMCRVLGLAPSGYYEWLHEPISKRAEEDARLLRLIRGRFPAQRIVIACLKVTARAARGDPMSRVPIDVR